MLASVKANTLPDSALQTATKIRLTLRLLNGSLRRGEHARSIYLDDVGGARLMNDFS